MLTKCHFIGIGGIGMSGLAKLLIKKNVQVSGSDIANSANVQSLSQAGVKVFIGHSPDHIQQWQQYGWRDLEHASRDTIQSPTTPSKVDLKGW